MNYEDFCTPAEIATFKTVKARQMRLARVAREEAAAMVGGRIRASGKEYVRTKRGWFRLAISWNSDNSTEREANDYAGAVTVVMGDKADMTAFLMAHGLPRYSYATFLARVRHRL